MDMTCETEYLTPTLRVRVEWDDDPERLDWQEECSQLAECGVHTFLAPSGWRDKPQMDSPALDFGTVDDYRMELRYMITPREFEVMTAGGGWDAWEVTDVSTSDILFSSEEELLARAFAADAVNRMLPAQCKGGELMQAEGNVTLDLCLQDCGSNGCLLIVDSGAPDAEDSHGCVVVTPQAHWYNKNTKEHEPFDGSTDMARRIAEQQLSTVQHVLEGEVYGYVVEKYTGELDEDGDPVDDDGWEELESCWGFIGELDYCMQEGKSEANHHMKEQVNEKANAA